MLPGQKCLNQEKEEELVFTVGMMLSPLLWSLPPMAPVFSSISLLGSKRNFSFVGMCVCTCTCRRLWSVVFLGGPAIPLKAVCVHVFISYVSNVYMCAGPLNVCS